MLNPVESDRLFTGNNNLLALPNQHRRSTSDLADAQSSPNPSPPKPEEKNLSELEQTDLHTKDVLSLSVSDKQFLDESWEILKPKAAKLGIKVFQAIFESSPETKDLFVSHFRVGVPEKINDQNLQFKFHTKRFMEVLETALAFIKDPSDTHLNVLHNIGQFHVKFRPKGFHPHYWYIFADAQLDVIIEELKGRCDIESAIGAWEKVIRFTVSHVRQGYLAAADRRSDIYVRARSLPLSRRAAKKKLQPYTSIDTTT